MFGRERGNRRDGKSTSLGGEVGSQYFPSPPRAKFAQLTTRKPRLLELKARAHVGLIDINGKTGDGARRITYGRWLDGRPCCLLAPWRREATVWKWGNEKFHGLRIFSFPRPRNMWAHWPECLGTQGRISTVSHRVIQMSTKLEEVLTGTVVRFGMAATVRRLDIWKERSDCDDPI